MIKLGIIGMSEGNAHPHSWSAIINGCYDAAEIDAMGYPAVSNYLKANEDTLGVSGAKVSCVWTQDRHISKSIAKTAKIETIANSLEEMVGMVDAVILARDDAKNHVAIAKPFIDAGIPIFIDKPLAITLEDLKYFSDQSAKGKFIMSCSSMRYSNECRIVKQEVSSLGPLELATAVGKKDWAKYGVHLLEALFSLLDDPKPISVKHLGVSGKDIVSIRFESGLLTTLHLFMDISPTFQVSLFGQKGWRLIDIKNSYSMFRDNIIEFVRSVEEGRPRLPFEKTEMIVKTLIGAMESLENGGKTVYLK
ncbi:Gfo/Idh/MocA family oxidoreductase [Arenibacter algicola]|uniref:Inositol 2-dehydrogenase/D-chiro-inositol 3-dehydrogenase n=1 Tax=Arenibacter algicola TaxID=616991 RepID=A0A221UTU3_9FLAO|nr:Gfo/Idh/MocA family oxidoreductase [Arenibacter algicola]ASO04618.1 inositol 2-dehydrogenase/D-chiro-inositol 3-dehydrogenase [Arenibacter algicola]